MSNHSGKILVILLLGILFLVFFSYLFYLWGFHDIGNPPTISISYHSGEYEKQALVMIPDNNGVKDYLQAVLAFDSASFDGKPGEYYDSSPAALLSNVVNKGWTENNPRVVELLLKNKKAMDLVKQGSQKDIIEFPNLDNIDIYTTPPNYKAVLDLSKLLVAEGRRFESQKQYSNALDDYFTALKFGQVYGGKNVNFISKLISISPESIAYNVLMSFIKNNPSLDNKVYADLLSRLDSARKNETLIKFAYQNLYHARYKKIKNMSRKPSAIMSDIGMKNGYSIGLYYFLNKGTVLNHINSFDNTLLAALDKPYSQFNSVNWEMEAGNLDPVLRVSSSNITHIYIRDLVMLNKAGLTYMSAALHSYNSQNKHFPDSLQDINQSVMDPFTDKPYLYIKTDNGFTLYSPGPDLVDDKAQLLYDPTNGLISNGDIVLE